MQDFWRSVYNKPIRNTLLNFIKLISDLDTEIISPDSWECKNSKYGYQPADHITGTWKLFLTQESVQLFPKDLNIDFFPHWLHKMSGSSWWCFKWFLYALV